jgi:DNA polymerase-3 subunit alpha (Gram-positive type)
MIVPKDYVVVDMEMTGLSAKYHKVIEIGAVRVRDGKVTDALELFVNPGCPIPENITELTGITDGMVLHGLSEDEAMEQLLVFIGEDVIVGQNVNFDYSFLKQWEINHKRKSVRFGCDTLKIARYLLPPEQPKKLENLCEYFHIERTRAHRALDDAIETGKVFECLKELAQESFKSSAETIEKLFSPKLLVYHGKKQTPATARQIQRLKEYCSKHQITDEINYANLTKSEASRMMDRYLAKYGK